MGTIYQAVPKTENFNYKQEVGKNFDIKLDTKDFLRALSFCIPIVEKRNVDLILNNVKLYTSTVSDTKQNILEITATDNDIFIYQQLPIRLSYKNVNITLPLHTLSDIIRKIPDSELSLSCTNDNQIVQIKGDRHLEFNLSTLPIDNFPIIEEITEAEFVIHVSSSKLAQMIEHTKFSMSTEETRYNLNGIYLHSDKPGSVISAATDGHRLSVCCTDCAMDTPVSLPPNNKFGIILPRKTATELFRILKEPSISSYDVTIKITNNKIQFNCQNITIVSKLIDGNFPEYHKFVPIDNPKKLVINARYLAEAIDRVSAITIEKSRAVSLKLTQDTIEIYAYGETRGEAKEILCKHKDEQSSDIVYEYNSNEELSIAFNSKYLLDALTICNDTKVSIEFKDPVSPALIKLSEENIISTFVIMPVNIPPKNI